MLADVQARSTSNDHRSPWAITAEERRSCDTEEGVRSYWCFTGGTIPVTEKWEAQSIAVGIPGRMLAGLKTEPCRGLTMNTLYTVAVVYSKSSCNLYFTC